MITFYCQRCKQRLLLQDLLDHSPCYNPLIDVLTFSCPVDGTTVAETRLSTGYLIHGYTYAAGTLHFSPEETLEIPELEVTKKQNILLVTLGQKQWAIPIPHD